ncbi:universal stress protein [Methanolobus bombayensis]|uniref:universal stress protein n=1 Tax=Methanolobus bombayensis TaxID=38023 RepID=UPI001AE7ACAE|nr:universal stress protein [Methanolobus bombayensis]MBP1909915.1 nucleotide-binding universal stress UspA family protein [Methanolobus bombayensis]
MSVEINKIVLATDGSENVKNAIDWSIEIAKTNDAEIIALYVLPNPGVTLAMRGENWVKGLHEHLKEEGKDAIQYVVDTGENEGVKVDRMIIEDKNPADAIVDFAKDNNADLIVMGTQGRTGLSHILLGSVAENVVRHAKRQVLVVP